MPEFVAATDHSTAAEWVPDLSECDGRIFHNATHQPTATDSDESEHSAATAGAAWVQCQSATNGTSTAIFVAASVSNGVIRTDAGDHAATGSVYTAATAAKERVCAQWAVQSALIERHGVKRED